jgi:hypothetical protein
LKEEKQKRRGREGGRGYRHRNETRQDETKSKTGQGREMNTDMQCIEASNPMRLGR